MELMVQPLRAATMSKRRAIVTAVIESATGDQGPMVEATPHVTDVTNGRSSVTHLR
jgi:hypothetical protein